MNAITTRSLTSQPPALASPELKRKVDQITARVGWFGHVPKLIDCEVGPITRDVLAGRYAEITRALAPCDPREIETPLLQLFALTKLPRPDSDSPEDLARLYAAHLCSLPAWAIVEACGFFARGGGDSKTFAPAAPEIFTEARRRMEAFLRERNQLHAILTAVPDTSVPLSEPGETERRAAKVKAALDGFSRTHSFGPTAARRETEKPEGTASA